MTKPFFSVITLTKNSSKTIEACLISLYEQTFTNFEHIIQDNESTDETIEIIRNRKDKRTKIISEKDHGLYDALNRGISKSKGEYIVILHSDDLLYNHRY